jgi:hypothetical protein
LKRATDKAKEEKSAVDLEAYAGHYNAQPWWGEAAVLPWQGKLAVFGLPSENPAKGLTLLKHIEGDTFRRLRKDETLGEEVKFERDKAGKVVRMWQHSNYENNEQLSFFWIENPGDVSLIFSHIFCPAPFMTM